MKPKILIVEDDPDASKALAIRLKADGFVVLHSITAINTLLLAREEQPDVIILDLGLPDLDGYSILKELKEFPPTTCIPVIVLTARDPQGNQERSHETGAFEFFQKPANHKWLLESINRALAQRNASDKSSKDEV
jgi:two-component system, OmpR family, copper resistance phosphate regulon response regulator CusR